MRACGRRSPAFTCSAVSTFDSEIKGNDMKMSHCAARLKEREKVPERSLRVAHR